MDVYLADEQSLEVDTDAMLRVARTVLEGEGLPPETEVSLLLVDQTSMSDLHERFMGEPGPTDVLAFPMEDEEDEVGPGWPPGRLSDPPDLPYLLGDVVICPPVAARQADAAGWSIDDEMRLLLVHGLLHLLGYDHGDDEAARRMEQRQTRYLTTGDA